MGGTSKRRELAFTDGSNAAHAEERVGATTDLHIRLWTHTQNQDHPQWLSWKSACVPVHMISDLVAACNGVLLPEEQDRLGVRFDSPQRAIAAAKRIQWALLGFSQGQPLQPVAAGILVETASGEPAAGTRSSLAAAKPAQILVAEAVYERLSGVPGLEFRNFGTEGGVYELVWASSETYRLWEQSLNQPLASAPEPAQEIHSATRMMQSPVYLATSEPEPADQPMAVFGQVKEPSNGCGLPANDCFRSGTESGTTEVGPSNSNHSQADSRSSSGRRMLFAIGGIVAIFAVALVWTMVHRNARQTADQQMKASKEATAAPVAQPSLPALRPPDVSLTQTAAASLPAGPPAVAPATVSAPQVEPKDNEDDSRGRKGKRDRAERHGRKDRSADEDDDEPSAKGQDKKAGGECQLLANEISSYLGIADKNRAAGKYADAAREYSAVMECDRHNPRAHEGLAKIKQARAVSGTDDSE